MRFSNEATSATRLILSLRLGLLLMALAFFSSGCSRAIGACRVLAAANNPRVGTLDVALSLQFSATQLAALDHGIPLALEFIVTPEQAPEQLVRVQLSYLPMAKRYQLSAPGTAAREFSSRVQLLAALDQVRLPLALQSGAKGTISMRLDSSALPAPMRLPALFDPEWRLQCAPFHWASSP